MAELANLFQAAFCVACFVGISTDRLIEAGLHELFVFKSLIQGLIRRVRITKMGLGISTRSFSKWHLVVVELYEKLMCKRHRVTANPYITIEDITLLPVFPFVWSCDR